jgi:cytochrome c oxidase assembly protein subunit 15
MQASVTSGIVVGASAAQARKRIAVWLLVVCAMIFSMVVLGGVTRLTESGLSIVKWEPVMGVVPPLTHQAWEKEFTDYQAYPEYQKKNRGMTLDEFKHIYWFEYSHRLLGRLIGFAFLLPLIYFWATGQVERRLKPRLAVAFVLGGLQGLLGWYMVESGLVDNPDVSPYRLTAHLGLAFIVYAYLFWIALGLLFGRERIWSPLAKGAGCLTGLIFFQILLGGLVAGTNAGFSYNTWPDMAGSFIPSGILFQHPWYLNFFTNDATIQFQHRMVAYLVILSVLVLYVKARWGAPARYAVLSVNLLAGMVVLQAALGILTLLLVVPIPVAAAHQAGALLLFTASLFATHRIAAEAPVAPRFT